MGIWVGGWLWPVEPQARTCALVWSLKDEDVPGGQTGSRRCGGLLDGGTAVPWRLRGASLQVQAAWLCGAQALGGHGGARSNS